MKHPIRRRFLYSGFRALCAFFQLLPLRVVSFLGSLMGSICWLILPGQKQLAYDQLDLAFGDSKSRHEKRGIVWQVFLNLGKNFCEWLKMPRLTGDDLLRLVECRGIEHIHAAQERGRGVIMLSAHFGNWEIISPYLTAKGFKGAVLARKLRYPEYESFLLKMRLGKGVGTIERSRFRDVAKALKENQLIGVMPDQDVDSLEGIFVEFFGRPAYTPVGPAAVALMTKAAIVPCFIRREGPGFVLEVLPEIPSPESTDRKEVLLEWTQRWSRVVESQIRKYPDHWVWVHRRWKTRLEEAEAGHENE